MGTASHPGTGSAARARTSLAPGEAAGRVQLPDRASASHLMLLRDFSRALPWTAAALSFLNMCALKGKRLLPACLTPSSWQHPTIHVIKPYWDLSRDIVKQARVYLREAVLIAQWDKELAGTRQISRWHGKGTAGLRLTMGCSKRKSLSAVAFFSLQTAVFFLNSSYSCVLFAHFKNKKTVTALLVFGWVAPLEAPLQEMLLLWHTAAEPGWGSGATTPPSCSPRLASLIHCLCCFWRWQPHLTVIHPGVTLDSELLSFQPGVCRGCGIALLGESLRADMCLGLTLCRGGSRMVLAVGFLMGVHNGLESSGCCWPWGRLSGPRRSSQEGHLGEDAGFPKGTRPDSTVVTPILEQV